MDWNELRGKWQARDGAGAADALARPKSVRRLWGRVRWRDTLESVIAFLLVPFFAVAAFWLARGGLWPAAAFALFLVAVLVYIPWRLWRTRRLIPKSDPNRPVREFLAAERAALAAQATMLRSVSRWYYGPIAVGVIGFYASIHGAAWSTLLYALFVLALCAAIEAANQSAVRMRFQPAIDLLDKQIHQLEDEIDD